ncbi:MAG: serine protease [Clostridiaceae bacterium]|nr:serine protease [Clostridiaceae bacterium]
MLRQLIKPKFIVVLFLLSFMCVSGCNSNKKVGKPSATPLVDDSVKTETTIDPSSSSSKDPAESRPNTSETTGTDSSDRSEATTGSTAGNSKTTDTSGDNQDDPNTVVTRPILTTDPEEAPIVLAWTEIFEKINPSVASIRLKIPASTLYQEREEMFSSLIIDEEGILISSYSMFAKAVDYRGVLMDGASVEVFIDNYLKPFSAVLYGFDAMSDIAILKIDPEGNKLTAQPISKRNNVKVGLPIGVIASPENFVMQGSLIPGHVMSLQVPSVRENGLPYEIFVSDVPTLNKVPGAPLVDEYGRVLGICSASNQYSYLDYRTYIIPSPIIVDVIDYITGVVENPPVRAATLGIAVMTDESAAQFSQRYDYPIGLNVTCVQLNSPAYIAGLRIGDIILAINNNKAELTEDLIESMKEMSIGSYCVMKVFRPSEDTELTFSSYLQQARH